MYNRGSGGERDHLLGFVSDDFVLVLFSFLHEDRPWAKQGCARRRFVVVNDSGLASELLFEIS